MSSLTTSQRQQRLTNVLLAGNLYKAHKIGKQLTQITALHKMSLGVSIANLKVNLAIYKNLQKKEAEEKKIKLLKDIFFQISEEMEEVEENKSYPLEKYFLFLSLKAELEKNEIDTSLADDLSEKKMISSTTKTLNKTIENLDKKFNKQERKDQELILNILEVDEEKQIKSLDSNANARMDKILKVFEKYLVDTKTFKKGEGHSPNSKKVGFFDFFRYSILYLSTYAKHASSYSEMKSSGFEPKLNKTDPTVKEFYEKLSENIQENFDVKKEKKLGKMGESVMFETQAMFLKLTPLYQKAFRDSQKKAGQKLSKEICEKEYFYLSNKKFIDEFYDLVSKSFKNTFKKTNKGRSEDLNKIKKLKSDIQKEKDLVKQIYKKHKFVEKILASRV